MYPYCVSLIQVPEQQPSYLEKDGGVLRGRPAAQVLLLIFMSMGALMMGNLLQDFVADNDMDFEDRKWVWMRYGHFFADFSRGSSSS